MDSKRFNIPSLGSEETVGRLEISIATFFGGLDVFLMVNVGKNMPYKDSMGYIYIYILYI